MHNGLENIPSPGFGGILLKEDVLNMNNIYIAFIYKVFWALALNYISILLTLREIQITKEFQELFN